MTDWQQRVIEERDALNERLGRLDAFLMDDGNLERVDPHEMNRLHWQRSLMRAYSAVLAERIEAFG
jgi:hypothetical protein